MTGGTCMTRSGARWRDPISCPSGVWHSEAARALTARWGSPDPVDAMRAAVRAVLEDAQVARPPVNLSLVGSFCGILRTDVVAMQPSGRLIPVAGGYRIEVNASESRARQRFSEAHEIVHTMVPSGHTGARGRTDATTGEFPTGNEEEHLCDVGASEMLMPTKLFEADASGMVLAIDSVVRLAGVFDVSLEAAGIRLAQCGLFDCAVLVWEETLKTAQARALHSQHSFPGMEAFQPEPRLRIKFAAVSPALRAHFFPREKSADNDCLIQRCLDTDAPVCGRCYIPTGAGPVEFMTESCAAPYRVGDSTRRRVITLATPL